jgi:long-subunit acyl-CoA synthetase (AMP-forming)
MKKEMPLLSQVVVIGDNQKYLTMLVSLKCEVS